MRAGLLDRLVSVQLPTNTRGAFGEVLAGWNELAKVWARFTPTTGSESDENASRISKTVCVWTFRYLPGLRPDGRIVDDAGQEWRIKSVLLKGRNEWLEVTAELFYE